MQLLCQQMLASKSMREVLLITNCPNTSMQKSEMKLWVNKIAKIHHTMTLLEAYHHTQGRTGAADPQMKITDAFTELIECLKMGAYRGLIVDNAPLTSVAENITSE